VKQYVVDTHAFVWWTGRPKRLGRAAARALREVDVGRARAWIPAIVGVELTLLAEHGRRLSGGAELEAAVARNDHVRILPLDLAQAAEFALLGMLSDPFDRMIVAAARAAGHPLLTADAPIGESGLIQVIWD
jgi:PIN domain nuclease of toxin-antitoxin system